MRLVVSYADAYLISLFIRFLAATALHTNRLWVKGVKSPIPKGIPTLPTCFLASLCSINICTRALAAFH